LAVSEGGYRRGTSKSRNEGFGILEDDGLSNDSRYRVRQSVRRKVVDEGGYEVSTILTQSQSCQVKNTTYGGREGGLNRVVTPRKRKHKKEKDCDISLTRAIAKIN